VKKGVIKKAYYLEIYDVIPSRCINLVVAVEMRKRGFSFQEIGDFFQVSKQAARNLIRKYETTLIAMGGTPLKDRKHKKRKDAKTATTSATPSSQEIS
jgi:predicted DNA-binding protein YlxM (UPF0122 family)